MDEYEHSLIKASLELAYERIADAILGIRNLAIAPSVRRQLIDALRESLRLQPDVDLVRKAIQRAESYRYDGDELLRLRKHLDLIEPPVLPPMKPMSGVGGVTRKKATSKKRMAKGGRRRKPKFVKRKRKYAQRKLSHVAKRKRKTSSTRRGRSKASSSRSGGAGRR